MLEVGLGGRLDATNVAEPVVSAVVSLDFDHEAFLGTTLDAIAREKAGVMRRGRAVVLGPVPDEAREALLDEARRKGARVDRSPRAAPASRTHPDGRLTVETEAQTWTRLLPLPGAHQRDNLLVALRVLEEARAAGLPVDLARAARGPLAGCAGRAACNGSRAALPCSSTAPTTPRALAPSPRTSAPSGPSSSSSA